MNRYSLSTVKLKASFLSAVLLSSCASYDPVNVEKDFGNSVRNMIDQQVDRSDASQNPSNVKTGLDGETAMNSMETYRKGQIRSREKNALDQLKIGK